MPVVIRNMVTKSRQKQIPASGSTIIPHLQQQQLFNHQTPQTHFNPVPVPTPVHVSPVDLCIRKGRDGLVKVKSKLTFTRDMTFHQAFPLTHAKPPTNGKQLAVSIKKKNGEEPD
jgi:hypothetical protein